MSDIRERISDTAEARFFATESLKGTMKERIFRSALRYEAIRKGVTGVPFGAA